VRLSKFTRVLLIIVAVALGVRVWYVAAEKSGPCKITGAHGELYGSSPSECAVGDQIFYNSEANSVAAGDGFNEPLWSVTHPGVKAPPAADHPPLTVWVLAPVSWLSDHAPLSWIVKEPLHDHMREDRYTMVLLGTILVFLVGLLGRRVGGNWVGWIAAGIAAVSPNIWVNDGLVMSETITGLVVVCTLLCALGMRDRPTLLRAAVLGAVCGLAALARAELILFIPLLAIAAACMVRVPWRARRSLVAASTATAILVILPWVAFNMARFHDPTFISTNDGIALLGSNCDPMFNGRTIALTSIVPGPKDCLQDPPPPGDQSQVASIYRHRAFDYMKDHAGRLPVVMLARVGRTWSLFRPGDMVWFNVGEGREKWVTQLGLFFYYPTLIAAIGGSVVLWRRRRRFDLWVLVAPAIAVTIGSALTYGQTRFRVGAEPSLAVLAAVAIAAMFSRLPGTPDAAGDSPPGDSAPDGPEPPEPSDGDGLDRGLLVE
jgi:4-amino-4-deoxy-L-arabinose transferase-like glycosyltransferase